MTIEIGEEIKKKICQLISIPENDIEEIAKKVNLDYETVKEILSDEYFRCNLEYGRRLCCRG